MGRKWPWILFFVILVTVNPSFQDDSSEEEEDDCSLPPVKPSPFSCLAHMKKWTYNKHTGSCEEFVYGGCGGTKNLFNNEAQCLAKCNKKSLAKGKASPAISPCTLPRIDGACRSFTKRFYFNTTTNQCQEFTYGGCHGNANNFQTLQECQQACPRSLIQTPIFTFPKKGGKGKAEKKAVDKSVCSLPPLETPFSCYAFIPKWTYNSTSQMCERYIYGGCGGTGNLFDTQAECKTVCQSELVESLNTRSNCLLPVDDGPCFDSIHRFAFKKDKNRCELFTYGGCGGNANNFVTADECFSACGGDPPNSDQECESVICHLEKYAHYFDRGCRPVYKTGACCPTSFSCPESESTQGQCHYRGIWYKSGESISQITEDNPCETNCICQTNPDNPTTTSIQCKVEECPAAPEGCISIYMPEHCCPQFVKCPLITDASNSSEEVDMCHFKGKDYIQGQLIDTSSVDPCKRCICSAGFTGLDGPGCRDIHCRINTRPGCVPVYVDNVCCPVADHCLDEMENSSKIIRLDSKPDAVTLPIQVTDVGESKDSGPFIKVGNAVTLPEKIDNEQPGSKSKKGPFIKVGNAVTLPAEIPGGRKGLRAKTDKCLLPAITGHCRARKIVFHYDADKGECVEFTFGGCGGNANRFDSVEECLLACKPDTSDTASSGPFIKVGGAVTLPALVPEGRSALRAKEERCLQPKLVGPCRARNINYYFDPDKQECFQFGYGGCHGNDNRFETEEECLQTCKLTPAEPRTAIAEINVCDLQQLVGPCRGQIPSYSFNSGTGMCEKFFYGGCHGNGNRFHTLEECQTRCPSNTTVEARSSSTSTKPKDVCQQPKEVGPCRGHKNRFFFNSETKMCEKFSYGGCRGNGNNFHTQSECEDACLLKDPVETPTLRSADICQLPRDVGPCRAAVPKFFYNSQAQECQPFTFGGCDGNRNKFDTNEECQSVCGSRPESRTVDARARHGHTHDHREGKNIKCKLPADPGFCRGFRNRYYYDVTDQTCKPFVWGGCLGNANNFATEEECLHECKEPEKLSGKRIHLEDPKPPSSTNSVCQLPIVNGPCQALIPQYGYNKATGECELFNYGGCRGNANRFETLEECQAQCQPSQPSVRTRKSDLDNTCTYGNETLRLGDMIIGSDPCIECICDTPPEISCWQRVCLPLPSPKHAICETRQVPGQCCPDISCVSANPPVHDPCRDVVCPPLPSPEVAICKTHKVPGQCCPGISCVSANPPVIDVCEDVVCPAGQHCKVEPQQNPDGTYAPPIGVCV